MNRAFCLGTLILAGLLSPATAAAPSASGTWTLHERVRTQDKASGEFALQERQVQWDPHRTAVIVCDMWNQHWCQGATARVAEMAPRMNEVLKAARRLGMLVIHCPSDTMKFYADTPGRKLAQQAPKVAMKPLPADWCPLATGHEPKLPFDNAKDRCDCTPQCPHGNPWRRQIDTLEIVDGDAITDNDEAFYLMRERGIDNVVVLGVHTNMCVLGRPFSIRRMCAQGQNVVLVRDLTDSMHDSLSEPVGLDHFRATDLVIEHIEKYWCPTITSRDFLGGVAFNFREDHRPHLAIVIGEDEYDMARTLPEFADRELSPRGVRTTILHASAGDKNDFPGLEALASADALLVGVRRRTPKTEQLQLIRDFVAEGKPVVGIRTASHAFSLRDNQPPAGYAAWPEFDAEVLGGHYTGHHANELGPTIWTLPTAKESPILRGVPAGEFVSQSSLYKTSPLAQSATPLMMGRVAGEKLEEPVAWTNTTRRGGKVFYTSLGGPEDFALPQFRQLLVNGVFWALGRPVPEIAANESSAATK
ncbi:MAG TPA: isochorismatase family protein [Pirellulales bacterium]|nr:isochorismatase family protein [Pirellulales bacterium]